MDYRTFRHCLRIQITPDGFAEDRIAQLTEHCVRYGFSNVMLLINAEEFNLGHITPQELAPWLDVLKKARSALLSAGISVSVNTWIEFGHLDRGRKLKDGQNFTRMTDLNGKRCDMVACPLCEEWQNYYIEYVRCVAGALQPDTWWIEDDFRYHNHDPLEWGGCFCEEHIAAFNAELHTDYTRETFAKKAFTKGGLNRERKAWMDVSRKSLVSLAEKIRDAVKSVSPHTDMGLMSSTPQMHCMEGRHWRELLSALGKGGHKINRIHLPGYFEESGKSYYYDFNAISMAVRAFCSEDTIILPETENGSANVYRKSPHFLRFQVASALPLGLSGMTYSIYDFVGNGIPDDLTAYAEQIAELTPFLQAVKDTGIRFDALSGVVVPIDEDASYHKTIERSFNDLCPKEFQTGAYLAAMGVTYAYSTQKEFYGKTVALFGAAIDDFTDRQIEKIFENNFVLTDGAGVRKLSARGLGELVKAKKATLVPAESGGQSYEECVSGERIYGVRGLRASCRKLAGDYVKIEYAEDVKVWTRTYKESSETFGEGIVSARNFAVIPYVFDKKLLTQFCSLRRYMLLKILFAQDHMCVASSAAGITPYLYDMPNKKVLLLVNSTVDNFAETECTVCGVSFNKIFGIMSNGQTKQLRYSVNGNKVRIYSELPYLSVAAFILQ